MDSLLEKIAKKLTTTGREHIKPSNFVFPKEEKYPIHDLAHARNALARVSANGSPSEKASVESKVYSKYPALKERSQEKTSELISKLAGAVMPMKKERRPLSTLKKLARAIPMEQQPKKKIDLLKFLSLGIMASKSPSARHALVDIGETELKGKIKSEVKNMAVQ